MATLDKGRISGIPHLVKGPLGEDHPKKIILNLDVMREDERNTFFVEIYFVDIGINVCMDLCFVDIFY